MANLAMFDIFAGTLNRNPVWVCAVQGLANAKGKMEQIASEKPGKYFVVSLATNEVLARTETFRKPQRPPLRHPLQSALEILRKIGYTVGEVSVIGDEPHVAMDGEPRTYEEILQLVAGYRSRKRVTGA